jgi:hypothetical protein
MRKLHTSLTGVLASGNPARVRIPAGRGSEKSGHGHGLGKIREFSVTKK